MIRVWKESIKLLQDFGIDKNLSERIMDMAIENLDPVRGSLEKVRSALYICCLYKWNQGNWT